MASFNRVVVMGNVTRDPEIKRLPSGVAVLDLGVAINEKSKNKAGELIEKTVFLDVAVWDKQAENCAQYLRKGAPVLVEGKLQMDEWTSKEGEKRSKLRVRADMVQFLGAPKRPGNEGGADAEFASSKGAADGDDLAEPRF